MRNLRVSGLGRALADPSRAEILCVLASGKPRTAGQLTAHVGLAASTTSRHLAELVDAGLVSVEASGRHRYFRLRSADVADLLVTIDKMDLPMPTIGRKSAAAPIATARTCYDHLAGDVGVALFRAVVDGGLVALSDQHEPTVTASGHARFGALGIDTRALQHDRRPVVRGCLDWEKQARHLGGSLGRALLGVMFERGWLDRRSDRRVVAVTSRGERELRRTFGLDLA